MTIDRSVANFLIIKSGKIPNRFGMDDNFGAKRSLLFYLQGSSMSFAMTRA